tara:strand:+ start:502 stop:2847 length:2346 start_codon:yes stop_codon:yes gene_type:complete
VGSSSAATFDFSIPQGADGTGSGDVTGPGSSTDNAIARFDATTGKLLQNSTVTVSDAGAIAAGSLTLTTDLAIADGGTGASTASAARTALNVDVAGTDNSTNVTLAGSLDYLTISGQTITRNAIDLATDTTGTLAIASGGTGATSASAARTALSAASSGANSDITSLTGLTTDLSVAQGGTGAGTFTANGVLVGNGTGAVTATAVGTSGQVLTSNGAGSAPTFQTAAGGGATDIDGLSDALTNSTGSTIGLGTNALANDNGGTSNNNVAIGLNALTDAVSVTNSIAIGTSSLENLTGSTYNQIAIGSNANKYPTGASNGIAIGSYAGAYLNGINNIALGLYALQGAGSLTTASYNVGIGQQTLWQVANSGSYNVAIGHFAGANTTTGTSNTFIGGNNTGDLLTTGSNNIVIGNTADPSSATVSNEITLGNTSVDKFRIPGINFIIKDSTATEDYVLTVDASGEAGWEAAAAAGATDINGLSDAKKLNSSTYGIGSGALADATAALDGNFNTAIGAGAGGGTKGNGAGNNPFQNTFVGSNAGYGVNQTGGTAGNVAIGFRAMWLHTGCLYNVIIGKDSGAAISTGSSNSSFGEQSLVAATTAGQCTNIGRLSGRHITTGSKNTSLGYEAGILTTTGSQCTSLGFQAMPSTATANNEFTLGGSYVSALRCQVQTISSLSDRRDKKDIEELPLGVDFINTLKPVKFTWNMRDGAKVGQQEAGFIAQDLDEAQIDAGAEDYLSLVLKNNPEKLEASYGKLVPVLVKAVQELSAEISNLKKEIANG